MDIYSTDVLGTRGAGQGSSRGPQRGQTADPFAGLAIVPAPSPKPAAQTAAPKPAPKTASLPVNSAAAKQVAAQQAASEKMAALLEEAKRLLEAQAHPAPAGQASYPGGPTLPGQTPSTSPAQVPGTGPVPQGTPAAVSKGAPIAGPKRMGFSLHPEDAWLARMQFNADTWIDLHPTARAVSLQSVGCPPQHMNSVMSALNKWCGHRTGRSPELAPASNMVPVQASQWPDNYGFQPVLRK